MEDNSPIIVFFTSLSCSHCRDFKGDSFFPSEKRQFSPSYIKTLLQMGENKKVKYLVEIVASEISNQSPIMEINFYLMTPPINILNRLIKNNPLITIDEIERSEFRTSLTKISLTRGNKIVFVSIDGLPNESLSFLYTEKYIWNNLPDYILDLKNRLIKKEDVSDILNSIEDRYLRNQILNKTQLKNYQDNPVSFEDHIFRRIFTFEYFLSKIIPLSIRVYEPHYPSWCLISKKEWNHGKNKQVPVYARATNFYTEKSSDGRYGIVRYTSSQTIMKLLEDYQSDIFELEYNEHKTVTKKYPWQK